MEVITIAGTVATIALKALDLAWYQRSKRKEAQNQIMQEQKKLEEAATSEGKKINSYIEFDKLMTWIAGTLETMLNINKQIEQNDELFWESIEIPHQQIQQAVTVSLHNFDITRFGDYHQGQVNGARPVLEQKVIESNALFKSHREKYIERLNQAKPEIGRMNGFGEQIIEEVGKSLINLGEH